jgi:hypothetical protein
MRTKEQNHKDRAHAVLSASGASRWLNCTPSARMCEGIQEETSAYATEGTLAHEYAENILRKKLGLITTKEYNLKNGDLRSHPMYTTDLDDEVDPYVTLVLEQIAEARATSPDALILLEEKVSLEVYIKEGFGTCDLIIIADGIMYITDLKFGKGVRVSAVENSQLMIYGVGALEAFGMLYDIHTVRLTICQPRLDAVSTWDIDAAELLTWAEEYVTKQAEKAYAGEGEHNPGDWCRFCKAKPFCPALREEALFIAEADFTEPEGLVEEEGLLEVYHIADRVVQYLDAVKAHIYSSALAGKKWPGLKLVQTKANRRIVDEAKAISILRKEGYAEELFLNTTVRLAGLGDLKKYLGEKKRDTLLKDVIIQPEGKPALVPESDNRPEVSSADDFAN